MTALTQGLDAAISRPIALRVRPDLTARRQLYQSRGYWIVKEPVGLKYFRFEDEEYAILRMLDGHRSLQQIKDEFESEFAPQKVSFAELQQFIGMLHRSCLAYTDAPGQGLQLKRRGAEKTKQARLGALSNVLAIRFRGIDPDWLLTKLYPYTRWFFTRTALIICLLLCLTALTHIVVHFDVFRSRLPAFHEFFGPSNWLWLGLTLAVVKVCHEFGHGLSCKHFRGECHEMGVMLLVLTPCLYVNVSDSWLLPNKWHRASIGAAGMYVEVVLASLATFVWWYSDPGLLNHLALRVMFICSVSTLMMNGNPLLRYDGYYILADILEIPNLRQKASTVLKRFAAQLCLGIEIPDDPFLPARNRFLFGAYTVASVCYSWFVLFSILWFLNKVLEPYKLKIIGQTIACAAIGGLVVVPLWQFAKFLHVPGRMDQVKTPRVLATLGVVAVVILAIALLPLPAYVYCSVHIEPQDATTVYVKTPGIIQNVSAKPGELVVAGRRLGQLSNPDMELELDNLRSRREDYSGERLSILRLQFDDPRVGGRLAEINDTIAKLDRQIAEREGQLQALTLESPVDGMVIPPAARASSPGEEGELPTWTGSPFDERNRSAFLSAGDQFCRIGEPGKLEAVLILDQHDIELIHTGQQVQIQLDAYAGDKLSSEITEISETDLRVSSRSASTQSGGGLATRTDASGKLRPLSTSYEASAPLGPQDKPIHVGMRGKARVFVGWQPLGSRLTRYVAKTFHFDM